MAKHWATLNVTGDRNADSPYAQPVCLFIPGAFPKHLHGRSAHNGKIKLTVTNKIPADEKTKNGSGDAVITSQVLYILLHIVLFFTHVCLNYHSHV